MAGPTIYSLYIEKFKPVEEYFTSQTELVWKLISLLDKHGLPGRRDKPDALLFSLLTHFGAISKLVQNGYIPEAYPLARSFFEKCVNYCYLNICSENEYENQLSWTRQKMVRAIYTKQKAFKNINHEIPLPELSEIIKVNDDLKKFTGKRGGEKYGWTEVSIYKRIQLIKNSLDSFPIEMYLLTMNRFYEDASEVIHGTLYGSLFYTGIFWGVRETQETSDKRLVVMALEIFFFLGYIINGILEVSLTIVPSDELLKQSKDAFSKLTAIDNWMTP